MAGQARHSNATLAAAIAAACALCAPLTIASEGWIKHAYPDPVAKMTACAGHTGPDVDPAHVYTDEECRDLLARDLLAHGEAVASCVNIDMSLKTRAAFTDFAFNVGSAAFCGSTMARKANAGDLVGACAELSRWVYAGGKVLPGLVTRRKAERDLCEAGLAT